MRAELDERRAVVEVIDEGSGFQRNARELEIDAVSGRGLAIVDAESSRWGIRAGSTHVWFELGRRPHAARNAAGD